VIDSDNYTDGLIYLVFLLFSRWWSR